MTKAGSDSSSKDSSDPSANERAPAGAGDLSTQPSLLARVRDLADHAAWRAFDAKYRDLIARYCMRRGLQPSDAEDVRQMVMLNLAKQLRTFEYTPAKGRFRDYLGRTVRNAIHRFFRKPRHEVHGLDTSLVSDLAGADDLERDEEWEHEWMLHHHRMAMQSVRETAEPRSVEIFEHLLAGETPDQVAEHFGMKRDAVHKVKQRMRDRLKKQVAQQIHDEEGLDQPPDPA